MGNVTAGRAGRAAKLLGFEFPERPFVKLAQQPLPLVVDQAKLVDLHRLFDVDNLNRADSPRKKATVLRVTDEGVVRRLRDQERRPQVLGGALHAAGEVYRVAECP